MDPAPFLRQLEELPERGCRRLILLGDIFQIWIADPRFEIPLVARTLEGVDRLRERGVEVDYIEGNRDFFVAEGGYAGRFDRVGLEMSAEVDELRILALHGDGIDASDRQYALWRRVSKSPPVRWAIRSLPPRVAAGLASRIEKRLARTNFRHRMRIPEEVIREVARERLVEAGADLLLLGHFHEDRRWTVDSGEVRIVEAWFHRHHVAWWGDGDPPTTVDSP